MYTSMICPGTLYELLSYGILTGPSPSLTSPAGRVCGGSGRLSRTLNLLDTLARHLHGQLSIRFGPRAGYWHITHEKYEPSVDYVIRPRKPSQRGDRPYSPASHRRGLLIRYLTTAHYALPILIPQQFGLTEKQRSWGRGAGRSGACATVTLPAAVSSPTEPRAHTPVLTPPRGGVASSSFTNTFTPFTTPISMFSASANTRLLKDQIVSYPL